MRNTFKPTEEEELSFGLTVLVHLCRAFLSCIFKFGASRISEDFLLSVGL